MTVLVDTIREARTRSLGQVRSAREHVLAYNERVAGTVVGALPHIDRSERVPSPTELLDAYFSFVDRVQGSNRTFARRMISAWDRPADEVAGDEVAGDEVAGDEVAGAGTTPVKKTPVKAAAKKAPARKAPAGKASAKKAPVEKVEAEAAAKKGADKQGA